MHLSDEGWDDEAGDLVRVKRTSGSHAGLTVLASVLIIVNAVLAVLSAVSGLFNLFAYDRCADASVSCNYGVGSPALWSLVAFNVIIWVLALVVTTRLLGRERPAWLVQLAALVLLLGAWCAYVVIIYKATGG